MKNNLTFNIIHLYNVISIAPSRPYPFISLMLHSVLPTPGARPNSRPTWHPIPGFRYTNLSSSRSNNLPIAEPSNSSSSRSSNLPTSHPSDSSSSRFNNLPTSQSNNSLSSHPTPILRPDTLPPRIPTLHPTDSLKRPWEEFALVEIKEERKGDHKGVWYSHNEHAEGSDKLLPRLDASSKRSYTSHALGEDPKEPPLQRPVEEREEEVKPISINPKRPVPENAKQYPIEPPELVIVQNGEGRPRFGQENPKYITTPTLDQMARRRPEGPFALMGDKPPVPSRGYMINEAGERVILSVIDQLETNIGSWGIIGDMIIQINGTDLAPVFVFFRTTYILYKSMKAVHYPFTINKYYDISAFLLYVAIVGIIPTAYIIYFLFYLTGSCKSIQKIFYKNYLKAKIINKSKSYLYTNVYLRSAFLTAAVNSPYNDGNLNMFNIKLKKENFDKPELINNINYTGRTKHYPPGNKEWFNSVYAYNNNTVKWLPSQDKTTNKLIKSYFDIYSSELEENIKVPHLRIRARRSSTNKTLVSKAEVKHTNDKAVITVYVYDRQVIYYQNKISRISSIDQVDKLIPLKEKTQIIENGKTWPSTSTVRTVKAKGFNLKSKVKHQQDKLTLFLNKNVPTRFNNNTRETKSTKESHRQPKDNSDINKLIEENERKYLKDYVFKSLRKEIFSINFRQLIYFNKSKFGKHYLLPLSKLISYIYKKKVEFNFVNLKYIYLDSNIFSETLVTKLKNRNNRLLKVLKTSLMMFNLPPINMLAVFDEMYNRKKTIQSLKVSTLLSNLFRTKHNLNMQNVDILENSLLNIYSRNFYNSFYDLLKTENKVDNYAHILNSVFERLKHKFVTGIRIEVAGRLTRRNTADRSLSKLSYKGNIKNTDSSYKGLSTVLLRGFAKANLQYSSLACSLRIGSFGLKGWVSSS